MSFLRQFLHLNGDRPGCDGIGTWELVSGPGPVFIDNSAPDLGDAYATVSIPGTYTFLYTASNIDPYPTSTYELTCTVLDVDQFHLGPEKPIRTVTIHLRWVVIRFHLMIYLRRCMPGHNL